MGTPSSETYGAALFDFAGRTVARLVRRHVPPVVTLLDVGAGWGKYRWLLPEYEMDAVELWHPYVVQTRLDSYYRTVYETDVATVNLDWQTYGCVIFGDVLEHLEAAPAAELIARLTCPVVVAVPFEMPQEESDGNPYEAHRQVDLTEAVMAERYPSLTLVAHHHRPEEHTKAVYAKGLG